MSCARVRFTMWMLGAISALALSFASPAHATALTDNVWTPFYFGDAGSALYGTDTSDTTFTTGLITVDSILKISDAFYPGDNFSISVSNGTDVVATLTTPVVSFCGDSSCYVGPPLSTQETFDTAFSESSIFSSGEILLLAGFSYFITGNVVNSPLDGGEGAFELLTPVPGEIQTTPIPATWSLMLIGLAGLGFAAYRSSRKIGTAAFSAA